MFRHGKSEHSLGCLQRDCGPPPARDLELPCRNRAARRRDCGRPRPGAALRLQAPARAARRGPGSHALPGPAKAVPDQPRSNTASARVGRNLRAVLEAPVASSEGTGGSNGPPRPSRFKVPKPENSRAESSGGTMIATDQTLENLTLTINQEIHIQ